MTSHVTSRVVVVTGANGLVASGPTTWRDSLDDSLAELKSGLR